MTGDTSAGPSNGDITDGEPLGLLIVCLLAALAGAVDACGLSMLHDLYVSFMSGNTTSLGQALASGHWRRAGLIGRIIVSFVAGAALGTVVAVFTKQRRLPVILGLLTPLLALPALTPRGAGVAMALAMGMLNATMQRAGPVAVSVTYVTGTLAKFGRGIGLLLCGQARDWDWLLQGVPWIGLLGGAAAASVALADLGERTFWALPIASLLLALATWLPDRVRSTQSIQLGQR